jgi:3-hydroxy-9,10-secoandrosta-1,3,5(10)-triene-9,17-dione monooxygenase reductase component
MGVSIHPAAEELSLRSVLGHFPTGVVVVTANVGDEPVGMTLQSFLSLSLDPPLVLLSVAKSSTSWPKIATTGRFLVNVLSEGQADTARRFAKSGSDKFAGVGYAHRDELGGPLLDEISAWVDCRFEAEHDGGDHTIVVARVLGTATAECDEHAHAPLIFHRSGFPRLTNEQSSI